MDEPSGQSFQVTTSPEKKKRKPRPLSADTGEQKVVSPHVPQNIGQFFSSAGAERNTGRWHTKKGRHAHLNPGR